MRKFRAAAHWQRLAANWQQSTRGWRAMAPTPHDVPPQPSRSGHIRSMNSVRIQGRSAQALVGPSGRGAILHAPSRWACKQTRPIWARASKSEDDSAASVSFDGKHAVVIGGTGRVGSSSASALMSSCPGIRVTLASRNRESYEDAVARRPELSRAEFLALDIEDQSAVATALEGADLVIHTAGPFQRSENHNVLKAAIDTKTPYMDVSDDVKYSEVSRDQYADAAQEAGVPAIISAGIYPGVSNVMAAHIVSIARKEYNDDWTFRDEPGEGALEPDWLRYSYYTAGSGGAGPTILATSLLLAGEDVQVYKDGQEFTLPPVSNPRSVDFGPGIGRHGLFVYNLPETVSAFKYMGVRGSSARFATDPFLWNWGMWLVARLVPRQLLASPAFAKAAASALGPLVSAVDGAVGEAVAMKVELELQGQGTKKEAAGIFVHRKLSESVGTCVSAFAQSVLAGQTSPGVWYPEERGALSDRRALLKRASAGCERFDLNKPAWALESELNSTVGLIYW